MGSATKPRINFSLGYPNPGLLAVGDLQDAGSSILAQPDVLSQALEYGPDEGYQPLREEIAKWLTTFYQPTEAIGADRICVTGGASQNLASILQTFTDQVYTRNIWMIAPAYHCACRMFDDAGFCGRLRAVPEDDEGLQVDYLTQHIQMSEDAAQAKGNLTPVMKVARPWQKFYKHIIYAVPTFANPSGKVMSLRRREALVRIARKYDALIITDDVYDMLQWSTSSGKEHVYDQTACLPRIVDIDRYLDGGPIEKFGHAVSNGSFSKLVGPGCRTGWAEGTETFAYGLSQTGSNRSGGCPSHLAATILHDLLVKRLPQYIHDVLQPAYARRYRILISSIQEHLAPLGVTIPHSINGLAGGYFVWLDLPKNVQAAIVVKIALEEENLFLPPGSNFRVQGDDMCQSNKFENNVRISFSWTDEALLDEGIQRLARALKRALA